MIKRTARIYKVGERNPPKNTNLLIYMENGEINIADATIFEICPQGITHWAEIPPIEYPFEREAKKHK